MSDRYAADVFDEDGKFYIFDELDHGSECCGPFDTMAQANTEANMLNENDGLPDGIRPHQLQHALEKERSNHV